MLVLFQRQDILLVHYTSVGCRRISIEVVPQLVGKVRLTSRLQHGRLPDFNYGGLCAAWCGTWPFSAAYPQTVSDRKGPVACSTINGMGKEKPGQV